MRDTQPPVTWRVARLETEGTTFWGFIKKKKASSYSVSVYLIYVFSLVRLEALDSSPPALHMLSWHVDRSKEVVIAVQRRHEVARLKQSVVTRLHWLVTLRSAR